MLLFADDLKLFLIIETPNYAELLQNYISFLNDWCAKNSLLINIFKCKVLTFSKNGYHIFITTIYMILK